MFFAEYLKQVRAGSAGIRLNYRAIALLGWLKYVFGGYIMSDSERVRKPTEMAELFFSNAANTAFPGINKNGISSADMANVLHKLAGGLEEMAIGLRATYILLSEVKVLIQRQKL